MRVKESDKGENKLKKIILIIEKNKPTGRPVMTNTIDTTEERVNTIVQETTETQKTEMSKAEICFGALMAIAAIAGMWGVVSLLISFFLN